MGTNTIEKKFWSTKFVLLFLLFLLVIHGRYNTSGLHYTKYAFSGFHSYRNTCEKLQIGKYHFLEIWESCWKLEKTGETNRIQKWMSCNYDDDVQSLNDVSNSKTNVFFSDSELCTFVSPKAFVTFQKLFISHAFLFSLHSNHKTRIFQLL